ncbi:uncharacterized protein EAF02_002808 [Botrytis sinoallii]|uniref:uncharacterized protein n=1 Tax=Botrytis sinoallii TaxID=1463999 RepID=UPI0018FFD0BA|nr:uncharacterized protein EAF02_002808 [Botrytis sinoallii]KAF7888267.1 hypothetical protein EAF02_002808 [Botrytis sinoallii]
MSSISQAIKNALHRGKGGAKGNEDTKKAAPAAPAVPQHHAKSDPSVMAHQAHQVPGGDAYSVANEDNRNRGAQAANQAAHAAGQQQMAGQSSSTRQDELARLVAASNENNNRLPRYPGLERWSLIEKMADAHLHPNFNKKQPKGVERQNILKEVSIMRGLDHPNIIKLIEFSESKQYYYLVLELAPGGELFHQIVRLTYFSEDLSRHVIRQVAEALHYLHEEKGVVHRTSNQKNILFEPIPFIPTKNPRPKSAEDEDKENEGEFIKGVGSGGIGKIKIADFGLSKIVWDTQTMTPCGTVGYTAPEIVKDERYSKSVDMWALGCVLYTLLCGFPPFYDESIQVLTEKVARGQYTFLSPWWDEISKPAQDLVSHLLTVDPKKRYTIDQFLQHPWIKGSEEPTYAALDAPPLATPAVERQRQLGGGLRAFNPDLLESPGAGRRMDFRSPGAVHLREVFDVGYAVHRQEEEAKRKKNFKQGYRGTAALNPLNPIDDEDFDESDEENCDENGVPSKAPKSGQSDVAQVGDALRNTKLNPKSAAPAKGYGQHSAQVTASAKRDIKPRNGAFELNLDGATLLGRRQQQPPPSNLRESMVAQ